jgi:hypothetical protein
LIWSFIASIHIANAFFSSSLASSAPARTLIVNFPGPPYLLSTEGKGEEGMGIISPRDLATASSQLASRESTPKIAGSVGGEFPYLF